MTQQNIVEKRYRENLNGQLESLRTCLPSGIIDGRHQRDIEETACVTKTVSKAQVIAAAHNYIKSLESQKAQLVDENVLLKQQVAGLQELVKCDDCAVLNYLGSVQLQQPYDVVPVDN